MEITALDHIVITTADIKQCCAFYEGILGLKHEVINGHHAFYFGQQKINVHCKPREFLPAAAYPTYGSQDFCFVVKGDICKIKQEIESKGYPVEKDVVIRNGALGIMQSIYLRDADGNLVELAVYEK